MERSSSTMRGRRSGNWAMRANHQFADVAIYVVLGAREEKFSFSTLGSARETAADGAQNKKNKVKKRARANRRGGREGRGGSKSGHLVWGERLSCQLKTNRESPWAQKKGKN